MFAINLNKKRRRIILVIIIGIILFSCIWVNSYAMQHYQTINFSTGLVTATNLNVRRGPGLTYGTITSVYKNEYVRVFAKIGSWYVIQTDADYVGCVSSKYIKAIYPQANTNTNNNTGTNTVTGNLTSDEKEVFGLVNSQRTQNGLSALKIDNEVQRVAKIKAQDLVDNNYFAHESPTYGSPFNMLKSFKISYTTAGENLAGNSSNSAAVTAWMNSSGHRANILNSSFNYTGVGVVSSPKYGKIYVQMFIGK